MASCSDKQYLEVFPSVKAINEYGYLSAEEFSLLVMSLAFAIIYGISCLALILMTYLNKSGTLHYIFIVALVFDLIDSYTLYNILTRKNEGIDSIVSY